MEHSYLYPVWVVLRPAEDVPGQWVAHCLEFDVVTQGNSPSHALNMAREATEIVVENQRDPFLRRAPDQFFVEFVKLLRNARKIELSQLENAGPDGENKFVAFMVTMPIDVRAPTFDVPLLLGADHVEPIRAHA